MCAVRLLWRVVIGASVGVMPGKFSNMLSLSGCDVTNHFSLFSNSRQQHASCKDFTARKALTATATGRAELEAMRNQSETANLSEDASPARFSQAATVTNCVSYSKPDLIGTKQQRQNSRSSSTLVLHNLFRFSSAIGRVEDILISVGLHCCGLCTSACTSTRTPA